MTTREHSGHVKILFDVEDEDGDIEVESVWAIPVGTGYKIDNIPFYARDIACGDIVSAERDDDGMLRYVGLIEASGHSTIRLWFANEADVQGVRTHLRQMGCPSELDLARLVAVDITPSVPYDTVRAYLDSQESASVFEYEEACIGQG